MDQEPPQNRVAPNARAEADVALAASALNAKSRVYESTKEQGDLLAMSSAAANLHAKSQNLDWQLAKIQHLKDGWLTMDKDNQSRWLSREEQDVTVKPASS